MIIVTERLLLSKSKSTNLREDEDDLFVLQSREHLRSAGDDVVTGEDGFLLAPDDIHGRLASPRVRSIDDIVVHKTGRVNHLGNHGHSFLGFEQIRHSIQVVVEGSSNEHDDHRTERFAQAIEVVTGDFFEFRSLRPQLFADVQVQVVEVIFNQFEWIHFILRHLQDGRGLSKRRCGHLPARDTAAPAAQAAVAIAVHLYKREEELCVMT